MEYDLLLEECLVLLIDYLVLSLNGLDVLLMFGASDHKLSLNCVLPLFDVAEELLQIEFHLHSPVYFFHSFGHRLHLFLEVSQIRVVVVGPLGYRTEDICYDMPHFCLLIKLLELI